MSLKLVGNDGDASGLRVLFVVHHARDRAAGASGATQALGGALAHLGCDVSYFHFDDAFPDGATSEIGSALRFPWRVSKHLAHAAAECDVIDATTGDAWVWCRRGRPGAGRAALVTRSHGLEHVTSDDLRRRAAGGEMTLSRKYAVYHGGLRLWEVRQSLECADGAIFLNAADREYAVQRLHIDAEKSSVIVNGVRDELLDTMPQIEASTSGRIELAFVGSWIPRKGVRVLIDAVTELTRRNISFALRLLGTGRDASDILPLFPAAARASIAVLPSYRPEQLPQLLRGAEVLLHPSWTEGFSLALVEGMACGLAPIATASGGAATVVRTGETGVLLENESGIALADAVSLLAADPDGLLRMRRAARSCAEGLRWSAVARETVGVYRNALARRHARRPA